MTNRAALDETFDRIVHTVAVALKPLGYVQRGLLLRKVVGSNGAIVEFQLSDKSSDDQLVFTINLGVLYGELLGSDFRALQKANSMDAHLRQRIGMLMPDHRDRWWELTGSTDSVLLAKELSELVVTTAVPYLENYLSTDALVKLWESGKSPGLTAVQRARFLSDLRKTRGANH